MTGSRPELMISAGEMSSSNMTSTRRAALYGSTKSRGIWVWFWRGFVRGRGMLGRGGGDLVSKLKKTTIYLFRGNSISSLL